MPTGEINSYDGLEIIQAKAGSSKKVIVSDSIKNYEGMKFTKCIKTQGDSNYTNYVPQERAVKIYVEKPCVLNVYMMAGSSSAANPKAIVSRQGEIITRFDLRYSVLQKYSVYIDKPDYYYISGQAGTGSISMYYFDLRGIQKGDLNSDGKINPDDYILYLQYITDTVIFEDWQKKSADINNDSVVNESDKNDFITLINNKGGSLPQF